MYVDNHVCKFVTTEYIRFRNIKYKMIHIISWTLIFLIRLRFPATKSIADKNISIWSKIIKEEVEMKKKIYNEIARMW